MSFDIRTLKIIPRYLIIGILGTILATAGASAIQIWRIQEIIANSSVIPKDTSIDDILGQLYQAEYWAERYPTLAVQLNMAIIRCQVKRQDLVSATEIAKSIFAGRFNTPRASRNMFETIQNLPNKIINEAWNNNQVNRLSGYEELVTAVRQSGNYPRLVSLSKDIISIDPNSTLARSVKNYIPVESLPQQPEAITNTTEQPPSAAPPDHQKLLEKYVARKQWDKALFECNTLLTASPDDSSLLATKKLILVNGKRWAEVNASRAPCYSTTGKFLKSMSPGYILDVIDIIKSSREELALCSPIVGTFSETNFLVRTRDTVMHVGDFRKMSDVNQRLYSRKCDLLLQITALRTKLTSTVSDSKNPYASEYNAAKQAHEAYWAQVRELQKKQDAPSTSYEDRMRFGDELRKMKGEDVRLGMALEGAKKKYDEAASKSTATIQSPELTAMEKELAEIRSRIGSIN